MPHQVDFHTSGCCRDLDCSPLDTYFACPVCNAKEDSEANEMVGLTPEQFFQATETSPPLQARFTCDQCGQLFRILEAPQRVQEEDELPYWTAQVEPIDTYIMPTTYMTDWRNLGEGDPAWERTEAPYRLGYALTTDLTATVMVVRRFEVDPVDRDAHFTPQQPKRFLSTVVLRPGYFETLFALIDKDRAARRLESERSIKRMKRRMFWVKLKQKVGLK